MVTCMEYKEKRLEEDRMKRVNRILEHPLFLRGIEENKKSEENRVFCRHNMQHFMDVARLAYIFSLERGYDLDKEVIYAAALLHDIGRWQQYSLGIPHDKASAEMAENILKETGFDVNETRMIVCAIEEHRTAGNVEKLSEVLYDGDKISRECFSCESIRECNWADEKKNLRITW